MDATQSGRHPYELPSWELGPKGGLLSRRVPATRPRPLAPSGMREDGMWSDAGREDGLWSDFERATDILKRSCCPLLSFFPSSVSFLTQQLVCPLSRIEVSCHNPFLLSRLGRRRAPLLSLSCPVLSRHPCRSCLCPVLAAATRRSCPCPVSAAAAHRSCPCPVFGLPLRAVLVLSATGSPPDPSPLKLLLLQSPMHPFQ